MISAELYPINLKKEMFYINKKTMKFLSIVMFVILLLNNITTVNAQKNSTPKNNKDSITIYENEKEYVISSTENKNVIITTLYEEDKFIGYFEHDKKNNTIYSSITDNIVELDDKLEVAKHGMIYQSGSEYDINLKSGGDGTKNNPYKYCNPGSFVSLPNTNVSYSTIISLLGVAASAGTITAALIAQAGGAAVITTSIRRQITSSAASIAGTLIGMSSSYAKKHGVRMYKRNYCVLHHYVDNAWGDNYWFYGDKVRVYRVSRY